MDATKCQCCWMLNFAGASASWCYSGTGTVFTMSLTDLLANFCWGKHLRDRPGRKGWMTRGVRLWNPDAIPSERGALVYPDDDGTANWFSPSLDLKTGLFYQNVREKGAIQRLTRMKPAYESRKVVYGSEPIADSRRGALGRSARAGLENRRNALGISSPHAALVRSAFHRR